MSMQGTTRPEPPEEEWAQAFVEEMEEQTLAAKDNLLAAKIQ